MSERIVVYEKPTCTTCRQVHSALVDAGVEFDKVNYYIEPLSQEKLRELIAKMGITPRELLRTKEDVYKQLKLGESEVSDDELIRLMAKHPELVQRPIVEKGNRAILARPAERIKAFLS